MRPGLEDRVAVVTGAAGGLGQAICRVLAREGAQMVKVDLVGEGCDHLDVATEEGARRMLELAQARHGRLDVLILNAGAQFMAPLPEFPLNEWERLLGVLLTGPFLAIKHAWEALTRQPGGRIIVTASTSSLAGEAFKPAYVSAKHGVAGLVKVAALEGARFGLTVNAVAPGWMWTPMAEHQVDDQARLHGLSRDEVLDSMRSHNPAGRMVEPDEVAEVIAFLASNRASGVSGAVIPVDLASMA
ncbi:MAG: SDR family NAD(P)-dependent oxidoreductase [Gaiellales bacterium]